MQVSKNADQLVRITDFPLASAGAPVPVVLADEHTVVLVYYMDQEDKMAVITFSRCLTYKSGPPNEEAISGHPFYCKGLRPNTFYRVNHSSWIKDMITMNEVHPYHKERQYDDYIHYMLCFHDSIFECVAEKINSEIVIGNLFDCFDMMRMKLSI